MLLISAAVTITAYCLWAFEKQAALGVGGDAIWYQLSIVPFVLAILRYALFVDSGRGGQPDEVVLSDQGLQALGACGWRCSPSASMSTNAGPLTGPLNTGPRQAGPRQAGPRHAALPEGRRLLSGWGRTPVTAAHLNRPVTSQDARAALAAPGPRGVIARGLGRSYGDAAQNAGGDVVAPPASTGSSTSTWTPGGSGWRPASASTSSCAPCVPLGLWPVVTPGTRQVTVGGAIGSDIHGKNHHRDGTLQRPTSSALTIDTPALGPLTVVPTDDPDVFWATAGGMGLTGLILEATIGLLPVETSRMRVDTERMRRPRRPHGPHGRLRRRTTATPWPGSTAWPGAAPSGRSILELGDHARRDDLPAGERRSKPGAGLSPLRPARRRPGLGAVRPAQPVDDRRLQRAVVPQVARAGRGSPRAGSVPSSTPSTWSPAGTGSTDGGGSSSTRWSCPTAPSDVCARPSRCSAPPGAPRSSVSSSASARPTRRRCRSPARAGRWPSTSRPASTGLAPLLDRLDELVVEAGGRVYLAKDSRLRPELLAAMYPDLPRWRAVRNASTPSAGCAPICPAACGRCWTDTRPGPGMVRQEAESMKDALGAVQSVLVLGGSSDIGVAIAAELAGPARPRWSWPAATPTPSNAPPPPCGLPGAGEVTTLPFDADGHRSATTRFVAQVAETGRPTSTWSSSPSGCSATRRRTRPAATAPSGWPRPTTSARCRSALPLARLLAPPGPRHPGRAVVGRRRAGPQANFIYGSSKAGIDGFAQGLGRLPGGQRGAGADRPARLRAHQDDRGPAERRPCRRRPRPSPRPPPPALATGSEVVWVPATLRLVFAVFRHLPRPSSAGCPV